MSSRHCPECGESLKPKATDCICGWTSAPRNLRPEHHRMTDEQKAGYEAMGMRYPVDAIEAQANREYPKPANGFGDWWARRILRMVDLGKDMPLASVLIAKQVVKVWPPVDKELQSERSAIQEEML